METNKQHREVFRSLANYKSMHVGTAERLGKAKQLANASTLTEARKILFGVKPGQKPLRRM